MPAPSICESTCFLGKRLEHLEKVGCSTVFMMFYYFSGDVKEKLRIGLSRDIPSYPLYC